MPLYETVSVTIVPGRRTRRTAPHGRTTVRAGASLRAVGVDDRLGGGLPVGHPGPEGDRAPGRRVGHGDPAVHATGTYAQVTPES